MTADTFCFLDIETTGLYEEADTILEVAWAFTDSKFEYVDKPATFLVEQRAWDTTWNRLNSNAFVHEMHSKTGLLAALANRDNKLWDLDDIYTELDRALVKHTSNGLVHLSGRSVHFDKKFLVAENFGAMFDDTQPISFHHRMLDLSSVKIMLETAGVDPQQFEPELIGTPHRALDDVMADIRYARNLRSFIEGKVSL